MVQEQLPHKRRHAGPDEPKQAKGKTKAKTTVVKKETKKPDQKEGKGTTIETAPAAVPAPPTEPNT